MQTDLSPARSVHVRCVCTTVPTSGGHRVAVFSNMCVNYFSLLTLRDFSHTSVTILNSLNVNNVVATIPTSRCRRSLGLTFEK